MKQPTTQVTHACGPQDAINVAQTPLDTAVACPMASNPAAVISVSAGESIVSTNEVRPRLSPHTVKVNNLANERGVKLFVCDPRRLLTLQRFDLLAKCIYARHRAMGVQCAWARELYREHLRTFSHGAFREGDGSKQSFEDYLHSFHTLLDSIRVGGFSEQQSLIPVGRDQVIFDGSHRVAACLTHGKPVAGVLFDRQANRYDWRFFRQHGLAEKWLDAMALEYCRIQPRTHVVNLFPVAVGRDDEVRLILADYGEVIYEKPLPVSGNNGWWLIRQLYPKEHWIGNWMSQFDGARKDAGVRFGGPSPLRILLFQCDDLAKVKEAKARIRALYGKGNYSCHINDSPEETLRLAQLYFNANSLHFLNHAAPRHLNKFHQNLARCHAWIQETGIDPELICVDGSATMAAYGLRDAQDLDVLHFGAVDFSGVNPAINSHNDEIRYHAVGRDELIFNPDCHFYYEGLKFVSLPQLCSMKERRGESKDRADVELMKRLPGKDSPPALCLEPESKTEKVPVMFNQLALPRGGDQTSSQHGMSQVESGKSPIRLYYVPNGNDYHIAELLCGLFEQVKPFGCSGLQDYIDRRVLAHKTSGASDQLWEEVRQMRPDLVYVESGKNIEPAVLQRIRSELGIPVTMWFGDACVTPDLANRVLHYARHVDWQVVVDRRVEQQAVELGLGHVEFIPFFGYNHYFRPSGATKNIDILFTGRSYLGDFARYPFARQRLEFVRRINCEFGRRLLVVGEGWEAFSLSNCQPARVPEWEVNRLNNAAKIVLAFDAAQVQDFTSCRTWHALLGRSFVLTRKFPGIEKFFVNGRHLAWFESEEEGLRLLHHYLDCDGERERIAQAGQEWVRNNGWTFSNVVRYLVNRGLRLEESRFGEIHKSYSIPMEQPAGPSQPALGQVTSPPIMESALRVNSIPAPARQYLDEAERFFNEGNLARARDGLIRAVNLAPDHAEMLTALGGLHVQLGEWPEACLAYERLTTLVPDDPAVQVTLASASVLAGRWEQFEAALGKALELAPRHHGALRLLADLNLKSNRYPDAARTYYALLRANPDDLDVLLSLGVCFARMGDFATARTTFERVLELEPGHVLARENLGAIESSLRRTPEHDLKPARPASLPAAAHPAPGNWGGYHQAVAGVTEQHIEVRPVRIAGLACSAFQALKDYEIREVGCGLEAAGRMVAHVLRNKLGIAAEIPPGFWHDLVALPVECELRHGQTGETFDVLKPTSLEDITADFAVAENQRAGDIHGYTRLIREGANLGQPLYVTGRALQSLAPGVPVETASIYMLDGARRITASALAHRRMLPCLMLLHEQEFAWQVPAAEIQSLRERLAVLNWFENYQSIPLLGLSGQRTSRRFELLPLDLLRDQVVMDFGCHVGQACLKAVQAGARQVIGIEGMSDTYQAAVEVGRLANFANLRFARVNFNAADFDRQIETAWPEPADFSFFFSVYRTKELVQRDRLFAYLIQKTRKGIFFEGHAHPKIDSLEYYDWLFESFGLKYQFLGNSEGELRPLFFLDLIRSRLARNGQKLLPARTVGTPDGSERAVGSNSERPLVSAIVSTYAGERFIEGRLQDLLSQTLGERLEIIVVDSASPEQEGTVVKRFLAKHPNIRYVRTDQRETIYQAWNRGIRMARGQYITNANVDDRLRSDALEVLAGELDRNPEVALVYGDFYITNTENERFNSHVRTGYSIKPEYQPNIMLDGCHMGPQPMWRRSLHDELGWFDESLTVAGDYEFWCRIAARNPLKHVPQFLGLYLHNPEGMCNRNARVVAEETAQVQARYARQFPPPPSGLPRGFYFREAVKPGCFVNIGMVTYNRLEFTRQAIAALVENTAFPYVLTVVDNGSQDGSREYLKELQRQGAIKNLILLEQNVGVARASNLAWQAESDAQFYLKLDNDIVLQKCGWLERLVEAVERVPKLGAVGYNFEPVSYPVHTIQGVRLRIKDRGIIGGACFLIPKRSERAVGYWCEDYGLYGEEDGDYCTRLALAGLGFAYLEDENVGIHLPGGKAARIDEASKQALDRSEQAVHGDYRQWKDSRRQELQARGGTLTTNIAAYQQRQRSLYVTRGAFLGKIGNDLQVFERDDALVVLSLSGSLSDWDRQRALQWATRQGLDCSKARVIDENGRSLFCIARTASGASEQAEESAVTAPSLLANRRPDYLKMNSGWVEQCSREKASERAREIARRRSHSDEPPAALAQQRAGSQVEAPVGHAPLVSIVIPTFNNLELTRRCLNSVRDHTPSVPHEVVVVDNASTDGTVDFLQAEEALGRLRLVQNRHNQGFARACNQGAVEARGRFVLFLNNDTEVTPGWLEPMVGVASEPQAGVVGARLLYPDGRIQHAGIEFVRGVPDHPHRFADANAPEVSTRRELDMVTGACFCIARELFLKLGGFDEVYRNGVEDIDLCFRVRLAGYQVIYEPKSVVYHCEGQTPGRFDHVNENLRLFLGRWRHCLDARNRVIVPEVAQYIRSERGLLADLMDVRWEGTFRDLGSLSHVNRELTRALARRPEIQVSCGERGAELKERAGASKGCAVADRQVAPGSRLSRITVRHAWPPDWTAPPEGKWVLMQPWEFGAVPAEWVKQCQRVDEIWVPSTAVKRMFVESGVDTEKVHVVPNGIDPNVFCPEAKPIALPTKKSFKFLFVGGTIHRKGPDLLLNAYLENFTAADDVCLVIKDFGGQSCYAGQTFDEQIRQAQSRPNAPEILHLTEELPEMAGLYTACDCLVHPYRGEGFGLPVLEAMACGLPVIVTSGGATDDFANPTLVYPVPAQRKAIGGILSGMKLAGEGWLLEPVQVTLEAQMVWVFKHREEARAKGRNASEVVRREWTWEQAARKTAHRLQQLAWGRPERDTELRQSASQKIPISLPPVAWIGHLRPARELFEAQRLLEAWQATLAAIRSRPFHPEAYRLLAEIAHAAGDADQARSCAERAGQMAPGWEAARQTLHSLAGQSRSLGLPLPDAPEVTREARYSTRLTVCLITKNEERFLGQCLESVRDVADQIIVMDTGSTDWTKAIASRFNAEVYSCDWQDDFSVARNAALEHARGDWILILDADEVLRAADKVRLKQEMQAQHVMGYRLPIIDIGREEEGCSYVPRLFRNAPGLFFVGRIHEQVFSSVEVRRREWGLDCCFGKTTLLHHGYTPEMMVGRSKNERNLRLVEKALREMPDDPNLLMHHGLELVRAGKRDEAIVRYREALQAASALPAEDVTPELREALLTQFSTQLLAANDHEGVLEVLQGKLARAGNLPASLHFTLGMALMQLRRFAEGAEQFRQCLSKRAQPAYTPANKEIHKAGPNHCLALCLRQLNEIEAAGRAFMDALNDDPRSTAVRLDFAVHLHEQGQPVEALTLVHQIISMKPDALPAWQTGGRIALSQPAFLEFALDWTAEATKAFPDEPSLLAQRAEALLLSQQIPESLPYWRRLYASSNPRVIAGWLMCEWLSGTDPIFPKTLEVAISREFFSLYRKLVQFGAGEVVAAINAQHRQIRQRLPLIADVLDQLLRDVEQMAVA